MLFCSLFFFVSLRLSTLLGAFGGHFLGNEIAMDVRDNTTSGDGGLDERIEFLVSTNCKLQMAGCDSLHFEILGGIACKFEHFGTQIFENGCAIHGGSRGHTAVCSNSGLEMAMETSDRELQSGLN